LFERRKKEREKEKSGAKQPTRNIVARQPAERRSR
jgi:hypothetical protein